MSAGRPSHLYSQEIVSTTFPGVDAATAQQYRTIVQAVIPTTTMNLTLPQVQAYHDERERRERYGRGTACGRGPESQDRTRTAAYAAPAGATHLLQ
jgi:hypothetical protein